eukprot:CAMPEP_0205933334 /NCGR_PEP_ID=MMETSP1325-20131115/32763_1 /ASSEMBLY_ACC=CAM_ASM_000708 /TAXON_ID=236786 /ORGANISM="Florenciella sp., Strain RCC1007" /LENGTH=61 /DNA_ID=CAMNT_0053303175 /DNA_START=42 /DNA_END=224 /DNA_ORIENTATION=+
MTKNWMVTLISFASLMCVLSFVFCLMCMAGWKINVLESIDISIASGMAVDFVLHLAHSYNH